MGFNVWENHPKCTVNVNGVTKKTKCNGFDVITGNDCTWKFYSAESRE